MILFITGATHTGKTRLAQKLMEKYKIPYFCQDHLKMGLIRSHYTDLTPDNDQELTDYLWPVIREMAKTAIENEQNMIIEDVTSLLTGRKILMRNICETFDISACA